MFTGHILALCSYYKRGKRHTHTKKKNNINLTHSYQYSGKEARNENF